MEDANSFRNRLEERNPIKRVSVDERRSGKMGRDGYAVLDQARPAGQREPYAWPPGGNRNRPGLTQRVYDGPNIDYTE